jgi:acetoin:2,6-dichlorophenolindophenol oxidoreductase subunit beta
MREMSYAEALREALREEMAQDSRVFVLGEDIQIGMAYTVTRGLVAEFGEERVRDTPISESIIVGTAVGAAITGMRPVVEIMFADLLAVAMDQIVNQAAKLRYMSGSQLAVPVVIRVPGGAWGSFGPQHSQCLEAWFMHVPGLKVVIPSTPHDAKGLLKTAIRDDNPVMFLEHKKLYTVKGPVPEEEYTVPFGKAQIRREGDDVTIVATSWMVHRAMAAAEELQRDGISALVIDPRTLVPLDRDGLFEAVARTGRVVIAEEAHKVGGFGAQLASLIAEEALDTLDGPIVRVGALSAPVPTSPPLEQRILPDEQSIVRAVKGLLGTASAV